MINKRHSFNIIRTVSVFFFMFFCTDIKAQETNYKAYSLYVYNFMKYVDWPENQNQGDFIIMIFGKSNIEKELHNLANQKKIRGRNIIVKSTHSLDEITNCQLLYISEEKSSLIKNINTKLFGKGVLVVGEKDGLANKGASLSFATLDNDELSFDINKKVINQQNLKISAALLKLGEIVVQ